MLSWIVMILYMVCLAILYSNKKTTLAWLISFNLISPYIHIGGQTIDSQYICLPVFLLFLLMLKKGRLKIRVHNKLNQYILVMSGIYLIYFVSWIIFNRNSSGLINVYAGLLKNVLFMYLCAYLNPGVQGEILKQEFRKAILFVATINLLFSIVQYLDVDIGLQLIHALKNESTYSYAQAVTKWGKFARCFGVMNYPMTMGIFSVAGIAFFLLDRKCNQFVRIIGFVVLVMIGTLSASKSFMLGTAVILIVWLLFNSYFTGVNKRDLLRNAVLAFGLGVFVLCFDYIYSWIVDVLGAHYASYFLALRNFSDAFTTRYDSTEGVLSYMSDFLKEYWLMGVGPTSLRGEAVMDSAFFVILHNGGLLALIPILIYYVGLLYRGYIKKNMEVFLFTMVILISGVGFPTWTPSVDSIWLVFYICSIEEYSVSQCLNGIYREQEKYRLRNENDYAQKEEGRW